MIIYIKSSYKSNLNASMAFINTTYFSAFTHHLYLNHELIRIYFQQYTQKRWKEDGERRVSTKENTTNVAPVSPGIVEQKVFESEQT